MPTLGSRDNVFSYDPSNPTLSSGDALAKLYGIDYNENDIKAKFDAATTAEYTEKNQEYKNTENSYYQSLYGLQNSATDAIRRVNASAIATGASQGVTQANILSAMMNMQNTGSKTATDLANQRNLLAQQQAEAYTKNTVDAMTTANTLKGDVMTAAMNKYGFDTQNNAAMMQFYAALDAAAKQEWVGKYQADLARGASWI